MIATMRDVLVLTRTDFERLPKSYDEIQSRVPDVIFSRREPQRYFEAGPPPALVLEVLPTPRGSVERSEKIDDYPRRHP